MFCAYSQDYEVLSPIQSFIPITKFKEKGKFTEPLMNKRSTPEIAL